MRQQPMYGNPVNGNSSTANTGGRTQPQHHDIETPLTGDVDNSYGAPGSSQLKHDACNDFCAKFCGRRYDPVAEWLEYDYSKEDIVQKLQQQQNEMDSKIGKDDKRPDYKKKQRQSIKIIRSLPRIRNRNEYYVDSYNSEPWNFTCGTSESNGVWMNSNDQAGSIMAVLVWLLLIYSTITITLLTITEGISIWLGIIYSMLCFLALSSHAKTSLTDPGSVPKAAVPCETQRQLNTSHSMCGQCQTFKPPFSHHCRICNRCVSRMDHHCPWMNNCVGAGNLKHFILFLLYTWTCATYALCMFGWNYFFCNDEDCIFHPIVVHLVRVMTILCIGAFLFTSSMLMNVCYGLMTGIGTIDRLKKKATNTMSQSDEEPILLKDVFGIGGYYTWLLPFIDPIFDDYDNVMGYSMPTRLAREQQLMDYVSHTIKQQNSANQQERGITNNTTSPISTMTSNISISAAHVNMPTTIIVLPGEGSGGGRGINQSKSIELPQCVNEILPS